MVATSQANDQVSPAAVPGSNIDIGNTLEESVDAAANDTLFDLISCDRILRVDLISVSAFVQRYMFPYLSVCNYMRVCMCVGVCVRVFVCRAPDEQCLERL